MKFRSLQYHYHDSHLAKFRLGPRRELTLDIALDSVWNKGKQDAMVRFGGIGNYDEVAEYFRALPAPPYDDAFIVEIVGIQYVGQGAHWVVDLAGHGHIKINSHNVTEI